MFRRGEGRKGVGKGGGVVRERERGGIRVLSNEKKQQDYAIC